jgi:thioredoxin-related protein
VKRFHRGWIVAAAFTLATALAFGDDAEWTTNYQKALDQAKAENKAVLLDFTGSDWCGWCMKMKRETLDKPMFKSFAAQNLVLVEVDFPRAKQQPAEVKAQNAQLSQKFQVTGFPDFIVLDKDGQLLWRQDGYLEGGPAAFLNELQKHYHPAATATASTGGDDFDSFFHKPAQSPTP